MNYAEQQEYLRAHRWEWAGSALLLAVFAFVYVAESSPDRQTKFVFVLLLLGLLYTLNYLPKYLYLTTDGDRKYAWFLRFRWIVLAIVAALGLVVTRSAQQLAILGFSLAALAIINFSLGLARKRLPTERADLLPRIAFAADFGLLLILWLFGLRWSLPVLLAASAHLSLAVQEKRSQWFTAGLLASGLLLVLLCAPPDPRARSTGRLAGFAAASGLFATMVAATTELTRKAMRRQERNVNSALAELRAFTCTAEDTVRDLLVSSPKVLAENWRNAKPAEDDSEALAQWYRENSFYYLFDLTAFHLTYKHIAFTLDVLRLARGRCLDYGAGTGRLALELARRGERVIYFDVEGKTREFAEWRAERERLRVRFAGSKQDVAKLAPYDTIVSLDVLEHLPDLRGELDFLVSLLAPAGKLILTIPSGPTESHPMHLPHDMDVGEYLRRLGLRDAKTVWMRWAASETMRKKTALVYEKPAEVLVPSAIGQVAPAR